jgi:hypothetical protein
MTKTRNLSDLLDANGDVKSASLDNVPAVDLTNLSATNLTSGTVADARLPATALNSNVDLTNLSASNLTSGTIPTARITALPSGVGGKVLQVVTSSTSSTSGFSHDTIVSVASVSITPSSASSKIYITTRGTVTCYDYNSGDSNLYLRYYIFRDSTQVLEQIIHTADANTNSYMANTTNTSTSYLDSPSTTSAISYSIRVKVNSETSNTGNFTNGGITVMEIGD